MSRKESRRWIRAPFSKAGGPEAEGMTGGEAPKIGTDGPQGDGGRGGGSNEEEAGVQSPTSPEGGEYVAVGACNGDTALMPSGGARSVPPPDGGGNGGAAGGLGVLWRAALKDLGKSLLGMGGRKTEEPPAQDARNDDDDGRVLNPIPKLLLDEVVENARNGGLPQLVMLPDCLFPGDHAPPAQARREAADLTRRCAQRASSRCSRSSFTAACPSCASTRDTLLRAKKSKKPSRSTRGGHARRRRKSS